MRRLICGLFGHHWIDTDWPGWPISGTRYCDRCNETHPSVVAYTQRRVKELLDQPAGRSTEITATAAKTLTPRKRDDRLQEDP